MDSVTLKVKLKTLAEMSEFYFLQIANTPFTNGTIFWNFFSWVKWCCIEPLTDPHHHMSFYILPKIFTSINNVFYLIQYTKNVSFQHVINIKLLMKSFIFYFIIIVNIQCVFYIYQTSQFRMPHVMCLIATYG